MPQLSQQVFIDTSLFVSFVDRGDLNHNKTAKIFEYLGKYNFHVYTSNLVIIQVFNRLEKDLGTLISHDFLKTLLQSNIEILHPSEAEFSAAYRFLKINPQQQVSLVDILNARLMEKHNVPAILTFDYWHNLMGITVSRLINP
ncbi:MAG: hypothetical protein ACD_38C00107G0001 [uncultured bacterium]|nr:MAG: hypothetical protein ACD_38C00107G0001 [uncultured bacterium]KKQ82917.1 MAG: hypothetical protein UT04_C0043G0006 [Candidatus Daviesbacteria bacterium GW2011_GWF2_38_7]KKR15563.1 MAG: hypothetical protein UT45_C0018G0003 [Candidatus Daviesbacteria bacterium GW2011_GWA2_39_33]KKR24145.1 MAG: hypothetical protein UT54_C0028G0003 [Candidatus Daviesbacteria bacterium GW2011_GWB1_39_5]OGE22126.1 MAG: hypothetical protein A2778_01245 [Candidatus Daviesbacteria bacterium RIFCSPHIGHO2_01_FULL_4